MRIELTDRMLAIPHAAAARFAPPRTNLFDELVSEGYVALLKAASSYDPARGVPPAPWLLYCVGRHLRSVRNGTDPGGRHAARWARLASLDASRAGGLSLAEAVAGASPDPADAAAAADDVRLLSRLLSRLRPLDRAAYELRHGRGLSAAEIGRKLGVSRQQVRTVLARAEANLRTSVRHEGAPIT